MKGKEKFISGLATASVCSDNIDLRYFSQILEEFCEANGIDIWNIARKLDAVAEDIAVKEGPDEKLAMLYDLADCETYEELEEFIVTYKNRDFEGELADIKKDIKAVYKKCIKSLT